VGAAAGVAAVQRTRNAVVGASRSVIELHMGTQRRDRIADIGCAFVAIVADQTDAVALTSGCAGVGRGA